MIGSILVSGGHGIGALFDLLGFAIGIAGFLWICHQEGTTGQSIGKRQMGIRLIAEHGGQPIGFGMAIVRKIAHILDSIICGLPIGFLAPLWDAKNQTWADKIMNTLVIRA